MSFMQEHVTPKQTWIEIDGTHGTTFVPMDVLSTEEFNLVTLTTSDVSEKEYNEVLGDYYEGTIHSVCLKVGYGARLSASGYMDCTDWTVFDTEAAAIAYLEETYGDEDEDSDDDSEDE